MKRAIIGVLRYLPRRLRNAVMHVGFHIAHDEFERFAFQYAFAPHMFLGLSLLKARGLNPATIIDVGAFHGDWSRGVHAIWPDAKQFMVEPQAARIPQVRQTAAALGATLIPELLGRTAGEAVEFNVMASGSSVLPENSPVPREVERRTLHTLDSAVDAPNLKKPVVLKIDAQGYELEILAGAPAVLARTDAVLLEVSFIEINKGAPLAAEVVAAMAQYDFVMCEVLEIHRRPLDRAMNQVDFLFVRKDHPLMLDTRHWA